MVRALHQWLRVLTSSYQLGSDPKSRLTGFHPINSVAEYWSNVSAPSNCIKLHRQTHIRTHAKHVLPTRPQYLLIDTQ